MVREVFFNATPKIIHNQEARLNELRCATLLVRLKMEKIAPPPPPQVCHVTGINAGYAFWNAQYALNAKIRHFVTQF